MRAIFIIIKKEFRQVFRNKQMLGIIFIMPIFQLLLLANAATFEMKNIKIGFVDADNSASSRQLLSKFKASNYFDIVGQLHNIKEGEKALETRKVDAYFVLETNFEKNLFRENKSNTFIVVNAIDGAKASLAANYISNVILDFNNDFRRENIHISDIGTNINVLKNIKIDYQFWYNPELNYYNFMVPGLLVLLVALVGLFVAGMNIVREKEIGTIEQLNVTPIKKHELIIGKLLPFWIIGLFSLGFGLTIGKLVYDIPIVGSIGLLYLVAMVFMVVTLGIGFLISTITETQQQSMFITWFFTIVFILLSGLFTSIENMPNWAQAITYFNPLRYFMDSVRMILLKGSGFEDVYMNIIYLLIYAVAINTIAVRMYKKTG